MHTKINQMKKILNIFKIENIVKKKKELQLMSMKGNEVMNISHWEKKK